jgi:hypothetical protein
MRRSQNPILAVAGAVLAVSAARAQDPDDMQRAVARISLMDGQVSVQRGNDNEWVAGVINAPLMADDRIATGPNSRAEIQFDSSNLIRIGGNAEIHLTALDYNHYQMEIAHGTATFRVLRTSNVNIEVDTPSISIRPTKIGSYRITVADSGETQLTVRAGDVEVFTPKGSEWVSAGQTMDARGLASDPEFQTTAAIPVDDWDRWNESRDRALIDAYSSYQYVPPGIYGVEDLNGYGSWTDVPNYGYCWRPSVAAGWAPYSAGRWVWDDWYGWTWISYDPWGWAPYHYGRWFWEANYGWLWYPGALRVRHYWSPALVAFFGWGPGIGFGFGFGNIGWVPLAPFEVFHPWWGRGFYGAGFATRISITNVNVYNTYRNARVLNGVSGIRAEDFRNGRYGSGLMHASPEQLRSAGVVRGAMPVTPTSANLRFSDRHTAFAPRTTGARSFFTHQQPVAASRVPFAQQQRMLEQGINREGFSGARGNIGASATGPRSSGATRPEQNGATGGGWRRFGATAGQTADRPAGSRNDGGAAGFSRGETSRGVPGAQLGGSGWGGRQSPALQNTRPSQPPAGSGGGWQRFGDPGNSARQFGSPRPGFRYGQRIAPPVVHERQAAPSYSAPRQSAPGFSAPRPAVPSLSAPRSAPNFSAPRSGGGGGGKPSGGGGGHHR